MIHEQVVLVLRRSGSFSEIIRKAGYGVTDLEVVTARPVADRREFRAMFKNAVRYDGVILTSPVAAEVLRREISNKDVGFDGAIYALGARAFESLRPLGLDLRGDGTANNAEEMICGFGIEEFAGKRLLFIRGNRSLPTVPNLLRGVAELDETVVYETLDVALRIDDITPIENALKRGEMSIVCAFSPSGLENFSRYFPSDRLGEIGVAALGETTASKARELGYRVSLTSPRPDPETFARRLIEELETVG